ncbi:uncharacterized protein LOC119580544 [Penaeus monodon]|uniref:uncharacterized protein LOC119580544 n=1 Tax=Penaeus monodon TaxID=6687 RepID=UPI0018A71303|nr:uncharacterized protein LOC119580544 [Penaeus monodon]
MELRILVAQIANRLLSGFVRRLNSLLQLFRMPRPQEPDTPTSSSDLVLCPTDEFMVTLLITLVSGDVHSFLNLVQEGRLIICDERDWRVVAKVNPLHHDGSATPARGEPSRAPASRGPTMPLGRDVLPAQTVDALSAQDAGLTSGCAADSASGQVADISSESPSGQLPSRQASDFLPECPSVLSDGADVPSGNAGISLEQDADASPGEDADIPLGQNADIPAGESDVPSAGEPEHDPDVPPSNL